MGCLYERIKQKSYDRTKARAAAFGIANKKSVGIIKDKIGKSDIYDFEEAKEGSDYFEVIKFRKPKGKNVLQDSGRSGKKDKPIKSKEPKESNAGDTGNSVD